MFSPDLQRSLGDAAIVPDGDHIYIGNNHWMILLLQPENFLDPDMIEFIREIDPSDNDEVGFIDWRILNSVGVDAQNLQFLPAGARRYQSLYHPRHQNFLQSDVEKIRATHNDNTSHAVEPRMNLTELFREGKMRANYSQAKSEGGPVRGNRVDSYSYADDEFVIGVMGAMMQFCIDQELELYVSTERDGTPQPQGAMDLERGIVLLVGPMLPSFPRESPDGRVLHYEPNRVCWYSEEDGFEDIEGTITPFDPLHINQDTVIDRLLGTAGRDAWATHAPLGISILRWHGVPEETIRGELEKAQTATWPQLHQQTIEGIARDVDRLSADIESGLIAQKWRRQSWKRKIQEYCDRLEKLSEILGELDMGHLADLVEMDLEHLQED